MLWYDPMMKIHGKTTSNSRYSMNTRQFSCEAGTAVIAKDAQPSYHCRVIGAGQ
jgi:hypothetical protein